MSLAVNEFKKHFDMVEIEGLCLTLEQNETTGSSLGLLQNQSEILQANHIFKIQKDTKKKEYIVIFSMILILINIASVILYPIVSQINQSLKTIFS
jgi:methionyl-tRNA synthetase